MQMKIPQTSYLFRILPGASAHYRIYLQQSHISLEKSLSLNSFSMQREKVFCVEGRKNFHDVIKTIANHDDDEFIPVFRWYKLYFQSI